MSLLTIPDAAERLSVSARTIRREIAAGRMGRQSPAPAPIWRTGGAV